MATENGQSVQAIVDDLSSPPSSLASSPQRGDPNAANSRDALNFGVSAHPPAPQHAPATTASSDEQKPKSTRNSRGPVVLPDGSIRERKKPGPKPKPKDPNAPEKPKRKRQKVSDGPTSAPAPAPVAPVPAVTQENNANVYVHQPQVPTPQPPPPTHSAPRQSKITDLVNPMPAQPRAVSEVYHHTPHHSPPQAHHQLSHLNSQPATPRPASSGQVFDPIRGEVSSRVSNPSYSPSGSHTYNNGQAPRFAPSTSATSAPVSPQHSMSKPAPTTYMPPQPQHQASLIPQRASAPAPAPPTIPSHTDEMDIDKPPVSAPKIEAHSTAPSSNAPTPPPQKRAKAAEQPPPLPTGSGLLSGTPFGGIGAAQSLNGENANGTGKTGTNIWLTFSLKGQTNVTINFAREVEKRYGFAALHPRLAARKERQRALAAAGAALEKAQGIAGGEADEMSLDVSEAESGNEGDEKSGNDNASNAQTGDDNANGKKKTRRKRKAEDYDRGDDFIDDTELAWEESALMARDGFFVYSGPLMAEGEKPSLESANGTSKRGRGRGRGGATRGESSGRGSRGGATGGRGSRGGATARKPRVTKADRAMMEQEKAEREKKAAALATKPAAAAAPVLPSQVGAGAPLLVPPTLPSQGVGLQAQ